MPNIWTSSNDIKERLSVGLVTLIAARAGCQVMEYPVDRMSADIHISPVHGKKLGIDAQLKATSGLIVADDGFKFDLPRKNYDDLRDTEVATPQLLIVVDLHDANGKWVNQNSKRVRFRRSAYWVSLYGSDPTSNETSVRITIPSEQILTAEAVQDMFERCGAILAAGGGGL